MNFDSKALTELCNKAWLNDDNTLTKFGRKLILCMFIFCIIAIPKTIIWRFKK